MVKHRFSRPSIRAAACMCVLACGWSVAQAQTTNSAGISDLRFELIDLNPDDGIAPGVTFGGSLQVWNAGPLVPSGEVDSEGGIIWLEGSNPLLPTGELQSGSRTWLAPELNGQTLTGSIGQGQASAGVSTTRQDLQTGLQQNTYTYERWVDSGTAVNPDTGVLSYYNDYQPQVETSYFFAPYQTLRGESFDGATMPTLTVTPGTLLVLSGKLYTRQQVDVASFRDVLMENIGEDFSGYADGVAGSSARLELSGMAPSDGGGSNEYLFTKALSSGLSFDANGAMVELPEGADPMTYGTDQTASESFAFAIDNLSSSELLLNMNLYAEANTTINVTGARNVGGVVRSWGAAVDTSIPTTPVIPEPGTWALMGLGLAAVAVARRRQAGLTAHQAHA